MSVVAGGGDRSGILEACARQRSIPHPPLPIVCRATLLCSRVYGRGRERRVHAHTHTALHSDVCLKPGTVLVGLGRKITGRFILSGCSLCPALEK